MYIDPHKNSRNIKFLFELLECTYISPTASQRYLPSSERLWNLQQEMSLTEMSLRSRTQEKNEEEKEISSDLQDTSRTRISDPGNIRFRGDARDQIWGHCEGHWADSCFPGSRPSRASRNNKTIPYDLYL